MNLDSLSECVGDFLQHGEGISFVVGVFEPSNVWLENADTVLSSLEEHLCGFTLLPKPFSTKHFQEIDALHFIVLADVGNFRTPAARADPSLFRHDSETANYGQTDYERVGLILLTSGINQIRVSAQNLGTLALNCFVKLNENGTVLACPENDIILFGLFRFKSLRTESTEITICATASSVNFSHAAGKTS